MNNKEKLLTRIFATIFVILLLLPSVGYFFHLAPGRKLFGYVEKTNISKPEKPLTSWFNKEWQTYLEEEINQNLGFRALAIRLYNDLYFRLFRQHPRLEIVSTKEQGLYFIDSIAHLNKEYLNRDKLSKTYEAFAAQLAEIQHLLSAKGKHFEVIIASSKPYVYLKGLGRRYLVDDNLYETAISLGPILKAHGINVIDSAPILRDLNKRTGIETHPNSGVHWNYYAGCIIAKQLFKDLRTSLNKLPSLDCGKPTYKIAESIDKDGYLLLNLKTKNSLLLQTPRPNPTATFSSTYLPNILIVGDSFMHQIISALDQAKVYSNMRVSSYYRTNIYHKPGKELSYQDPSPIEQVEHEILDAATTADIVILEMVDYNIPLLGYGFSKALLTRLKEES